ncbi:hypothetical protein EDB85DRAFT_1885884 [Lactarius pseudohatsudake]|nr:hypothetical protein EDB85DRAFT_1885884 [Lactarius pseudohatsudake]
MAARKLPTHPFAALLLFPCKWNGRTGVVRELAGPPFSRTKATHEQRAACECRHGSCVPPPLVACRGGPFAPCTLICVAHNGNGCTPWAICGKRGHTTQLQAEAGM